jgi:hypothetical protein
MTRVIYPPEYEYDINKTIEILKDNDGTGSGLDAEEFKGFTYNKLLSNTEMINQLAGLINTVKESPIIVKPKVIFPLNNSTDIVNIEILVDNYETIDTFTGHHTGTTWQFSTDDDFNDIAEESVEDSLNPLSYLPSNLEDETDYYVRVKFHSDRHYSEWSDIIKFTTGLSPSIEVPKISISGFPDNVPAIPTAITSVFNVINDNDTHVSTDWILEDFNGVSVWTNLEDTFNLTKYEFTSGMMEKDKTYILKVRYRGINHISDWGILTFTVTSDNGILPPVITMDGWPDNITLTPTFSGGAFITSGLNTTHESTDITIKDYEDNVVWDYSVTTDPKTIFSVPAGVLYLNSKFTLEMRYNGPDDKSGWTEFEFTPVNLNKIARPTLDIINTNPLIPLIPELVSSPFISPSGTETHISTDWIVKDIYDRVVWQSLNNTINLTSITINDISLEPNTTYTFIVKHRSNDFISNSGYFVGKTDDFTIVSPPNFLVEGENNNVPNFGISGGPKITTSLFNSSAPNDIHKSTDYRIENSDGSLIWESIDNTNDLTEIYVPAGTLAPGVEFTFKVRHNGVIYKSGWSEKTLTTFIDIISDRWIEKQYPSDLHYANGFPISLGTEWVLIPGLMDSDTLPANIITKLVNIEDGYSIDITSKPNCPKKINFYGSQLKKNKIILLGGEDYSTGSMVPKYDKYQIFDYDTGEWSTELDLNNNLTNIRAVAINENMVYVTGTPNDIFSNRTFLINLVDNSISPMVDHPENFTNYSIGLMNNGNIIAIGGLDSNGIISNRVFSFNFSSNTWTQLADYPLTIINNDIILLNDGRTMSLGLYISPHWNGFSYPYIYNPDNETNGLPGNWVVADREQPFLTGFKHVKVGNGRIYSLGQILADPVRTTMNVYSY